MSVTRGHRAASNTSHIPGISGTSVRLDRSSHRSPPKASARHWAYVPTALAGDIPASRHGRVRRRGPNVVATISFLLLAAGCRTTTICKVPADPPTPVRWNLTTGAGLPSENWRGFPYATSEGADGVWAGPPESAVVTLTVGTSTIFFTTDNMLLRKSGDRLEASFRFADESLPAALARAERLCDSFAIADRRELLELRRSGGWRAGRSAVTSRATSAAENGVDSREVTLASYDDEDPTGQWHVTFVVRTGRPWPTRPVTRPATRSL